MNDYVSLHPAPDDESQIVDDPLEQSHVEELTSSTPDDEDTSAEPSEDEKIDSLIDEHARPLENFITELENRLTSGHSMTAIRNWAGKQHRISRKTFERCVGIIRQSWNIDGTSSFVLQQRRDEYRAMYRRVYCQALEASFTAQNPANLMAICVKAITEMADLDGLKSPDVSLIINQQASASDSNLTKEELTNKTRERVQLLFNKMRERAEEHAAKMTRNIVSTNRSRDDEDKFEVTSQSVMGSVK